MVPTFEGNRFEPNRETTRPIGKLLFGAAATAFVLGLVTLLPGVDRLLPGTDVSIVYWLSILAAVLVAHWGLAPLVAGVFDSLLWVYDTAFLLLALGPLLVIAVRRYASLDPAADAFAERVSGEGT